MDTMLKSSVRKCGIPEMLRAKWAGWRAAMRSHGLRKRSDSASVLRGLTPEESDLLMVRMLQELSLRYDIYFDDAEIPGLAGSPQLDELLDKIISQDAALLLRDEVSRLRSKEVVSYQRV